MNLSFSKKSLIFVLIYLDFYKLFYWESHIINKTDRNLKIQCDVLILNI